MIETRMVVDPMRLYVQARETDNKLIALIVDLWTMHDLLPAEFIAKRVAPLFKQRADFFLHRRALEGKPLFGDRDRDVLRVLHDDMNAVGKGVYQWDMITDERVYNFEADAANRILFMYQPLKTAFEIQIELTSDIPPIAERDFLQAKAIDNLWGRL